MKKIYYILLIPVLIQACAPQDPVAQLDRLRAQKTEIEDQIAVLEGQVNDSTVEKKINARYVEVKEINPTPFRHFIEVQGMVDTDQNVIVTSQSPGTISTIHVMEGDQVKKGQLMVTLDAQVLQNSIKEVRTSLSFATDLFEKQKELWEQKIGSEVQYLTAKNNKQSLEGRLATLNEQLSLTKVTSPINGVIDNLMAKAGEMVSPGMPMGRVVNLSNFEIKAQVAENYASRVKDGTKVILWFPDIKEEIEGVVSYTGRIIDPVNRTFRIVIRLANPDLSIKPNMVCVVKIIDFESEEALVIPVSTIQKTDLGTYVFVAEKSGENYVARRKKISYNMEYNGNLMVSEGLNNKDRLITFGYQDLTNGDIVKF